MRWLSVLHVVRAHADRACCPNPACRLAESTIALPITPSVRPADASEPRGGRREDVYCLCFFLARFRAAEAAASVNSRGDEGWLGVLRNFAMQSRNPCALRVCAARFGVSCFLLPRGAPLVDFAINEPCLQLLAPINPLT